MCDQVVLRESDKLVSKREFTFKYLIIGDFGVGKTSIIGRYAEARFSSVYKVTIGADFAHKSVDWDCDTTINLQLWDIAGSERFGSLTSVYYRYALGAAVVFDLTRPDTYNSTVKWIQDLRRHVQLSDGRDVPVILLANKGDMSVDCVPNDINQFCQKYNILNWFITSAKENVNIDEAMNVLIRKSIDNMNTYRIRNSDPIQLTQPTKTKKYRFCFL